MPAVTPFDVGDLPALRPAEAVKEGPVVPLVDGEDIAALLVVLAWGCDS